MSVKLIREIGTYDSAIGRSMPSRAKTACEMWNDAFPTAMPATHAIPVPRDDNMGYKRWSMYCAKDDSTLWHVGYIDTCSI